MNFDGIVNMGILCIWISAMPRWGAAVGLLKNTLLQFWGSYADFNPRYFMTQKCRNGVK